MPNQDDPSLTAFAALQNLRVAAGAGANEKVCASAIVAYARRTTTVVDLSIERTLRQRVGARRLYSSALGQVARASSFSVAAAADQVTTRQVGDWRLEIVEESSGFPWLVISAPPETAPVSMLELRCPDGTGRRLALGQPIDSIFQLPIDPGFEELAGLLDWLQDPLTEIHLI